MADNDILHMRTALQLARRGLGRVSPNPAVGCILVKEGIVVGRGWTQPGGRPHAETEALARAGTAARGATAYVTLEPCSHTGKTPPCADALIQAGVTRVVGALQDPDVRVSGRGFKMLQDAGIQVETGILEQEARLLNEGFFLHRLTHRPMVTLKVATSLDGRIALGNGDSKWITGERARLDAHGERASHDAVLIGIGTALADNPQLTVRLPGIHHSPMRVVLDSKARLPMGCHLTNGAVRTVQFIAAGKNDMSVSHSHLDDAAETVEQVAVDKSKDGQGLDINSVLTALAELGVTRLMIEGGGQVSAAFLKAGFVDRIVCYRAGVAIGGDGLPSLGELSLDRLALARRYRLVEHKAIDQDIKETWRPIA